VSNRAYGQYCGFARALEVVGERWAMMIVRDLLVGPQRFTDLQRGLPGIPSNVLTTRLKELEDAGVVRRNVQPRPARGIAYELTEYGLELEEVVVGLGRWGAKAMGDPRATETVTANSLIMALRSTFRPEAARGLQASYELRAGPIVFNARVDDGKLAVAEGSLSDADLVMEAGPAMKTLMTGEVSAADAIASGAIPVTGNPELLTRFAEMFRIEPMPNQRARARS
jgi:DNA-binding HxlR family transcriptional regulator